MPKHIYENADQQPVKFWLEVLSDLDKADHMDWEAYNQAIDYLRAAEAREKKQKEQQMTEPADAVAGLPALEPVAQIVPVKAEASTALTYFTQYQRDAKLLLESSFLPAWWKPGPKKSDKQAIADICIACQMARHYPNIDPLTILQNLYIIQGTPAWKSSFVISLINASGKYTRLIYDDVGDVAHMSTDPSAAIRLVGTLPNGDHDEGAWISWEMVKGEGWDNKPGSKWRTMPEQMARYRAASFFARTFCPHVLLGLYDDMEQRDIAAQERAGHEHN